MHMSKHMHMHVCTQKNKHTACTEVHLCGDYVLTHHPLDSGLVSPLNCTPGTEASSKHSIIVDRPPRRPPQEAPGCAWPYTGLSQTEDPRFLHKRSLPVLVRPSTFRLALTSLGQAAGTREDLGKPCPMNVLCSSFWG